MKQYVGNKIVKSDCAQAIDVTALDATCSELACLEPYPRNLRAVEHAKELVFENQAFKWACVVNV